MMKNRHVEITKIRKVMGAVKNLVADESDAESDDEGDCYFWTLFTGRKRGDDEGVLKRFRHLLLLYIQSKDDAVIQKIMKGCR